MRSAYPAPDVDGHDHAGVCHCPGRTACSCHLCLGRYADLDDLYDANYSVQKSSGANFETVVGEMGLGTPLEARIPMNTGLVGMKLKEAEEDLGEPLAEDLVVVDLGEQNYHRLADSWQEAVLEVEAVPESWVEAHRYTLDLAADTEGHKRVARTVPEGGTTAEGQVEDTMAAHTVHSLGRESGEEGPEAHRRLVADSHYDTKVGMAARSGTPEDKVQAAVVRMGWEVALGEDKGRQEAPMRFAEPEEDIEREVGHIELSPVP